MVAKTRPPLLQAAVVYNPSKVSIRKLKSAVANGAKAAGWSPPLWFATTEKDPGQRVTASAVRRGVSTVIAVGGDGTIRAVAEALRDTSVALAIVPSGTGNLLARNLDLGLGGMEQAIETAFTGANRAIDLGIAKIHRSSGEFDEHVFLVMAGLGLDAKMIATTNPRLKKTVGWLAYLSAGVRAIPSVKPIRLNFKLNDGPERAISVHTIIVGNCGVLQGGIVLLPDAKLDDGLLDVVVLRPRGPFGWLRIWNKVTWENGVLRKSVLGRKIIGLTPERQDVRYLRGTELLLTPELAQEVQLDGDELGAATILHTWVEQGALTVKVPHTTI